LRGVCRDRAVFEGEWHAGQKSLDVIGHREEDAVLVEGFLQGLMLPAHWEAIKAEPDRELVAGDLPTERWCKAQADLLLENFAYDTFVPFAVLGTFSLDIHGIACVDMSAMIRLNIRMDSPRTTLGRFSARPGTFRLRTSACHRDGETLISLTTS
jgi:hypothetical protein